VTASATIPAIEESTIWMKNNVSNGLFDGEDKDISLDDIRELKHTADSLGITLEDLKQLKRAKDSLDNAQ
jgi:hypothetical protein